MLKAIVATAVLGALAVPATAQQPAAATAGQSSSKASDADKIVCKREEQIGSRLMSKKVCMTVQEWQARQREDQDSVHKLQQDTPGPRSG